MVEAAWFPWIKNLSSHTLRSDVVAAITGATLAIPQGIAFAAIAGLPPEYGFYCAIVAPIIAILLGSSWHMVCGPTTAISALLYGALHQQFPVGTDAYIQAIITLTFIAGIIQLALGFSGFGIVSQFVSHSVMAGFITGAALLIMVSQIDTALQIQLPRTDNILLYLYDLPSRIQHANFYAFIVSGVTLCSALVCKWLMPRLPHYLIALFFGSCVAAYFNKTEEVVTTLGQLPNIIPPFGFPNLSGDLVSQLLPSALAIALVGLLEAASIAKAISLKTNQKIHINREFIGQGASNLIGSLFSSYMSSGSFTRSGVNVESGAKTPVSVVLMSLFLLMLLPSLAPLFTHLPHASIASVIILVGWRLIAAREIKHYFQRSKKELVILCVTLFGTLIFSMEVGLYIGVALSICLFLKSSMSPVVKTIAPVKSESGTFFHNVYRYQLPTCPQLHFFSIEGALFFGSIEHIDQKFNTLIQREGEKSYWIINGNDISDIDEHGAHYLKELIDQHHAKSGKTFFIMRSKWKLSKCKKYKLLDSIPKENIYPAKQAALENIIQTLDKDICHSCSTRIFSECPKLGKTIHSELTSNQHRDNNAQKDMINNAVFYNVEPQK
ncbi:SulP family inorganic anion transporter [Vibrio sp. EA2]|uniref:SulP family inorganic anion transporter n=1 Tax=Vibrio sp. EA2 TaxID=3079860 RepID=UPI002948EE67|nr:SulP family inorganic anion transporter [Vibrio sp. EA2]MDV6249987.1 SulP family inorganic anion transporter [Vibrio sp. EA2]